MYRVIRHWHNRDLRFLGMAGATLVLIALFLGTQQPLLKAEGSGWRRIDIEAFRQRLQSGDLSGREAQWYHPAQADDGTTQTAETAP